MALPLIIVRLILVPAFLFIALLESSEIVCAKTMRLTEETDKQALLEFKSQISETSRVVLDSWNGSLPLCSWTGVKCGPKHRRVTEVNLGGLKITGVVSPFVGNLSFLRSLNLAYNVFHGVIPLEIGNLFRLQYLNLSNNYLGGVIPTILSNCSRLSTLDLSSNHLEQSVPSELSSLSKLVFLSLGRNNLTGELPASLGNLTSLQILEFVYNQMEGEIPGSITQLKKMVFFNIAVNKFTGFLSPIYNLSSLIALSITNNRFSGTLRPDFGSLFPNLRQLFFGGNNFTGTIPDTVSNISTLQRLDISYNHLTGNIPLSFGKLQNLLWLGLQVNSLGTYSSNDLDFIGALTNCTQLQNLDVALNKLGGHQLPASMANLSTQLTHLSLMGNLISGSIPHGVGNLISMQTLSLSENLLTGKLPPSLGQLSGLRAVGLNGNELSGEIPSSLGNITWLTYLYLDINSFVGSIPSSLGSCINLQDLRLGDNRFNGIIPHELMELPSLLVLNVSINSLEGPLIEEVGNLKFLLSIDISHNKLSGRIPKTLVNCLSLEEIWLQGNSFVGPIPEIKGLTGLTSLDLSKNNLSGLIPEYMANFSKLQKLNLSFNDFHGAVPTKGIFGNASAISVVGNINLCGGIPSLQLQPCSILPARDSPVRKIIAICVSACIATLLLLFLSVVYLCRNKQRTKNDENSRSFSLLKSFYKKLSYGELYKITDGFSSNNLLGSGNFGSVFKGFLGSMNKAVAIKVLNLCKHGAAKSFLAECEALGGIRHRNLVKLITVCSSADYEGNEFRALVYEFMPNGSLDMWLYPTEVEEICRPSRTLTLFERLNIAMDVASVLDYLHLHCYGPIAHCDLKPSNVLLDDDLTAHVSDFGLARLLLKFDQDSFFNQLSSAGVRGTIGYAAPEYGVGGQPSIEGDVFSFGVLLLEMFTGKRPTNELFGDNITLQSYTKSALPEQALNIVDKSILDSGFRVGFPLSEFLTLVLGIGHRCCEESPSNRPAMSEILKELILTKERFFKSRRTARR